MKCQCHIEKFSNNTTFELEKLNKKIEEMNKKMDKLRNENLEFRKLNKNLNSKLNVLLNDNDIIKTVKEDIQDFSDLTHFYNEDYLKDFFYLLVLCEKMKYLNFDHIWMIESAILFKEVQTLDLPFYEWGSFIAKFLIEEKEKFDVKNNNIKNEVNNGIVSKLK